MTKIVEIETCSDCPYIGERLGRKTAGQMEYFCEDMSAFKLVYLNSLPDWCPLKEKEEKVEP